MYGKQESRVREAGGSDSPVSASQASGIAIPDKCSDRPKLCRAVVVILIRLNQARKQISSLL